jgi:hypothetical protein
VGFLGEMKIKFIKPTAPLGLAYFQGDEAEFEDKQAQSLIDAKFAVEVPSEKVEKPKKPK